MNDGFETTADEQTSAAADPQPSSQPSSQRGAPAVEPTGNPDVDAVLDSLEQLEGAPVSEQVPVFEAAHEQLRAALADAGNDAAAS